MTRLKLRIDLNQEIVEIGNEEYIVQEATAQIAALYQNHVINNTTLHDGKPTRVRDMGELEILLVKNCLYDSENKLVSEKKIRNWPESTVKILHDLISKMSGLSGDNEEVGKSSLNETEVSSE